MVLSLLSYFGLRRRGSCLFDSFCESNHIAMRGRGNHLLPCDPDRGLYLR